MPAIAEEAKQAKKQEVGDLAIEVIGKTIRVYEITGGSKLKQRAYSDTLQGQRFLMFSAPSKEVKPAKDFTITRLYGKPERARKIIGSYFPRYAAAGARAHFYYSGQGPRGRIAGVGEGYFSVSLGMGIGESIDEAKAKKYDPANYDGPKYKVGDRVRIVRRFGWKPKYRPTPIKPPVLGKVKRVMKHELYLKGPPILILTINPKDFERATPGVMPTETDEIWVHADEVESQKRAAGESDMPVEQPDPTFEQVARIVRRAKNAGFTPGRVILTEGRIQIDNYDFIFLLHHDSDDDDTYQVAHSVHDDPALGYQELQTGLARKSAERMVRSLKSRWKAARVRRFLVTGEGHKRKFLPESDAEITARIKADLDAEMKDPANKGRTLAQTLRALFGKDVDEARFSSLPMISKPRARQEIDRLGREYQKHKRAGDTKKAGETYALMRGVARMANMDPERVLRLAGVEEAIDEAVRLPRGPKLKNSTLNLRQSPWAEKSGPQCEVCRYFKAPNACAILVGPVDEYQLCDGIQGKDSIPRYKIPSGKVMAFVDGMVKEQPYQHKVLKGVLTPVGPLLIIQDTMKPTAHKFSLPWEFSIDHTSREHIWTQKEVDRLIAVGGRKGAVKEARMKAINLKTKEEVNYRKSVEDRDGDERCGDCAFIVMPAACKRVRGKIDQDFTCDLWKKGVAEDLDEVAAAGKVQTALLDFVKKLPSDAEFTLSDVTRRREFHNVHFKRLMSAAKSLAKKGLIWYDGFSNIGPPR